MPSSMFAMQLQLASKPSRYPRTLSMFFEASCCMRPRRSVARAGRIWIFWYLATHGFIHSPEGVIDLEAVASRAAHIALAVRIADCENRMLDDLPSPSASLTCNWSQQRIVCAVCRGSKDCPTVHVMIRHMLGGLSPWKSVFAKAGRGWDRKGRGGFEAGVRVAWPRGFVAVVW